MKAGVLFKKNEIRYSDVALPVITDDEVLVKVKYTGICGSDIPRVYGDASRRYPNILGHEFSGAVAAVGKNVTSVSIGDKVAGIPLIPCMKCEDCNNGNYSLCKHYSFIGSRQYGSMAEYVAVPEGNVFKANQEISYMDLAFFEPATVALHAIDLFGELKADCTVAILGGGTIGLLTAQIMKAYGAEKIAIIGRRKERLTVAEKIGFLDTFSTLDNDFIDEIVSFSENGFDYVIETSGSIETIKLAFKLVKNKGKISYIGTPKKELTFTVNEWELLNRKEATIIGSWMSYSNPFPGSEWKRVEQLYKEEKLKIYPEMVDKIYSLEDIGDAFACFTLEDGVMGKIIIDSEM